MMNDNDVIVFFLWLQATPREAPQDGPGAAAGSHQRGPGYVAVAGLAGM
jgi:hypothetical protein